MVEELVAATLVAASVVALTAASVASFKSYNKQQTISAMMALETELVSGLGSQSVQALIQTSLRNGKVDSGTDITVSVLQPDGTSVSRVIATVGQIKNFSRLSILDRKGDLSCTPSLLNPDCVITVEVDFSCQKTSYASIDVTKKGTTSFWNCAAAYRIASPGLANFGSNELVGKPFSPSTSDSTGDFTVPIAFESTSRVEQANCVPTPSNPNNLFATGYDINTGKLFCAQRVNPKKPGSDICGPNQISTEVVFDPITHRLKYQCKDLQGLSCPTNYALQRFSILSLRPAGTPHGQCVFVGAESAPFQKNPSPANTIKEQFCPRNYVIGSATCTPHVTSEGDGTCYYQCGCDAKGNNCSTCSYQAHNRGSATRPATGGQSTSCSLINTGQSCSGAYWNSDGVTISGTCVRAPFVPETLPATTL